jgi:hypothetical protein
MISTFSSLENQQNSIGKNGIVNTPTAFLSITREMAQRRKACSQTKLGGEDERC